tara:strand:+ start:88 stop:417 length:330 start_codon:yes stop_codon:yes gene_type:complete
MSWSNCTHDDNTYAKLKVEVANALGEEQYPMTLNGKDYATVATAWNQGIDSHLEALTNRSTVEWAGNKVSFSVHPDELPTLLRRLFEGEEQGEMFAGDIIYTLKIREYP